MPIQLRQICLVAHKLEPVIDDLCAILGINRCYVDPGVAAFGLENTLMPVGRNFLEVVAPIEPNTAGGRYLQRRQGDGGYMVITQADSEATQLEVRANALSNNVRIAHENVRDDWHLLQLHPGDLKAAFFEVESDAHNDFQGHWHPVGGSGWEDRVKQDITVDFLGVELQSDDPLGLAELWGRVAGVDVTRKVTRNGSEGVLSLNNAQLRFVKETDGRGAGLGGIDIAVANPAHIIAEAQKRGAFVCDEYVMICGTRWYLHDLDGVRLQSRSLP